MNAANDNVQLFCCCFFLVVVFQQTLYAANRSAVISVANASNCRDRKQAEYRGGHREFKWIYVANGSRDFSEKYIIFKNMCYLLLKGFFPLCFDPREMRRPAAPSSVHMDRWACLGFCTSPQHSTKV